jgi:hypothetical protein
MTGYSRTSQNICIDNNNLHQTKFNRVGIVRIGQVVVGTDGVQFAWRDSQGRRGTDQSEREAVGGFGRLKTVWLKE